MLGFTGITSEALTFSAPSTSANVHHATDSTREATPAAPDASTNRGPGGAGCTGEEAS